ncbi:sulfur carrier protein ThiS [Exiguobacterium sp. TDN 0502]|uniref:sulfur carrier protein ThiS n=1 Tax=Exiguobacterium sp. TDN 0502 TaxID=3420731 RepID=UPI003D77F41D
MNITINGNDHTIEQIETIEDMLTQLGLEEKLVIVEQNRQIIDRRAYGQTIVRDHDTFEIVHFVGGG